MSCAIFTPISIQAWSLNVVEGIFSLTQGHLINEDLQVLKKRGHTEAFSHHPDLSAAA